MRNRSRTSHVAAFAKNRWGVLSRSAIQSLRELVEKHKFSLVAGDVCFIHGGWYVTNAGLLALARRHRCTGIHTEPLTNLCDPDRARWFFRATVYPTKSRRGFVGYGDADPSNVAPLIQGAEMRVAETRAVNRALRKAYGIGICSVEEIGSVEPRSTPERPVRKLPPESSSGNSGHAGNGNGTRVRDRLCQLIRQHKLDAELVKSYAVDFCGTKTLSEASREQVEAFVAHLADWAAKDRNALLCQLNSYQRPQEPAAVSEQQRAGAA